MYKPRRLFALVMCLCALLSLCACGSSQKPEGFTPAVVLTPPPGENAPAAETPAVTGAVNVPAPAAVPAEAAEPKQLSPSEQYGLNIFLSNFAEQSFPGFTDFEKDFADCVDFMHLYIKINENANLVYRSLPNGKTYESIPLETANRVFSRFFRRDVQLETASQYVKTAYDGDIVYGMFYDGSFCFEPADGESYNRLAVADSVTPLPSGGYSVSFTVYALDINLYYGNNGISADYYHLTSAEAAAAAELSPITGGSAVVYEQSLGNRSTYYITGYTLNTP